MDENKKLEQKKEYQITGWDIVKVLLATLLVLVGMYIIVSVFQFMEMSKDGSMPTMEEINELAEQGRSGFPTSIKFAMLILQAAIAIPVILFLRGKKLPITRELRMHIVSPKLLGYSSLVGLAFVAVGDELGRLMGLIVEMPEEISAALMEALQMNSFIDVITIGLTAAIVAPLVEEMLFRGFMQRFFERKRGVTTGVLTTSAIFAAFHFNIYVLIPILLMGTVMGAMAWRAESIVPTVIVHAVNNTVGIILANINPDDLGWYEMGDHVSPFVLIIALVVMVLAIREFFKLAERKGLGGHGPRGDVGTKINKVI